MTLVTLLQFEYFVALAEAGSHTAAARAAGVTQPTLSQQIATLESPDRGLGRALFVRARVGQRAELTPAGEALLPHARQVLDLVKRARLAVAGSPPGGHDPRASSKVGAGRSRRRPARSEPVPDHEGAAGATPGASDGPGAGEG